MLESISGQMHFYGKLAHEDLGGTLALPPPPAALTAAERDAARRNPGFARALLLIGIGLRNEGVREWNFTLRGLGDRELLAAAQLACDREVWDRCINTSDRTRQEVDMAQRFPTPFRQEVVAQAREIGLDPAYVYGLIRQESRFIMDARSHVGASGLMQIMPATARWTAKKIGIDYKPDMITDRDVNLKLGTAYLKLVLDDFGGSQALAAAAYNAGPGRPRRWRDGPLMEPAAWAENIPFAETRDYVKKVLSNTVYYSALLGSKPHVAEGPAGPADRAARLARTGVRQGPAVSAMTACPACWAAPASSAARSASGWSSATAPMRLTVATRRLAHAKPVQFLPTVDPVECDVHDDAQLAQLVAGHDAVVNLIAILHGSAADFERVHVRLAAAPGQRLRGRRREAPGACQRARRERRTRRRTTCAARPRPKRSCTRRRWS